MIGIITGSRIGTNRDGDASRRLLQVQMLDEDVRTVELITLAGDDTNPANGCRCEVVDSSGVKICTAITDDLTPEVAAGERELYSTDSPATEKRARIKLASNGDITIDAYGGAKIEVKADGTVTINSGTKSAVTWEDLNTVMQAFIIALNAAFSAKLDGGGSAAALTLDLTSAQVTEVKLP